MNLIYGRVIYEITEIFFTCLCFQLFVKKKIYIYIYIYSERIICQYLIVLK